MENENNLINEPVTEETTDSQPINSSVSETPADTNSVSDDSQSNPQAKLLFVLSILFMYGFNFAFDIIVWVKVWITAGVGLRLNDILFYPAYAFFMRIGLLADSFSSYGTAGEFYLVILLSILTIAGFILLIILRVKYPRYRNGKILMRITIAYLLVSWIIIYIFCKMIDSCCYSCLPIH